MRVRVCVCVCVCVREREREREREKEKEGVDISQQRTNETANVKIMNNNKQQTTKINFTLP